MDMTIFLIAYAIVYVLWLIAIFVMGEADKILQITFFYVFSPLFAIAVLVITPIMIILSKETRRIAKEKYNE